jgi:hypothetical protein
LEAECGSSQQIQSRTLTSDKTLQQQEPWPDGDECDQSDEKDFIHYSTCDFDEDDDSSPDPFNTDVTSPRDNCTRRSGSKETFCQQNITCRSSTTENSIGWEGFVTSHNFETIPSDWETEEDSNDEDDDFTTYDSKTPDTSEFNHNLSADATGHHKSEWSETSPTSIFDFKNATETEWLKGNDPKKSGRNLIEKNGTTDQLRNKETESCFAKKALFSDDLFQKQPTNDEKWV